MYHSLTDTNTPLLIVNKGKNYSWRRREYPLLHLFYKRWWSVGATCGLMLEWRENTATALSDRFIQLIRFSLYGIVTLRTFGKEGVIRDFVTTVMKVWQVSLYQSFKLKTTIGPNSSAILLPPTSAWWFPTGSTCNLGATSAVVGVALILDRKSVV